MRTAPYITAAAAAGIGGYFLPDGYALAWGVMCGIAAWPWIFRES